MSQYTTRPSLSLGALFLRTAARVGQAGAVGLSHRYVGAAAEQDGSNCTPCAAMARREAARKIVRGE